MSFTDATYFRGELAIAGLSSAPVTENLGFFITKYETEFLNKVLGYAFAKLFLDGLAVVAPATPDQRWLDLRNGKAYTYQNVDGVWMGFQNASKQSPLANLIYYHYLRDQISQTVGVGQAQTNAENATIVSPAHKLMRAFNEMVDMQVSLVSYLLANADIYPEFKFEAGDLWALNYWQWNNYWLNFGYWPWDYMWQMCPNRLYKRINTFNI